MALADAGIDAEGQHGLNRDRIGCAIGAGIGGIATILRRRGADKNSIAAGYIAFADGLGRLMYTEGRAQVRTDRRWGYLSSGLMGVFFSAGWIPCVGPVLAAIYFLASKTRSVQARYQ